VTAQMLLVWPINEPWRGRLALVDEAVDDIDALVQEQGYQLGGVAVGAHLHRAGRSSCRCCS